MNIQNQECDHQRIDAFLNSDHVALDDSQLVEHLDTCAACREYIEMQAAEAEHWTNAKELLKVTEFDHASAVGRAAATFEHHRLEQSMASKNVLDSLAPSDDPNRLGRLGSYEVSGVVGVGGMGVVLKALDPALDRVVAIKVMAPHLANNGTARRRFSREAKAAAAVLHPNVIPIHSVCSDDAIPYLVMAYIRGGSLQKRLQRQGPLSTVEILRIGSQVAAGLAAAHAQGLVHRDVKPENILLEDGVERVTLTDFGLARAVDDASVTRDGAIAGTPQYMSPEQARGESVDQPSDLFSLGSVLYALCTGRPPFRAETSYGVMRRIIDESAVPIHKINPEIPAWLAQIVNKLMAKDKKERFTSADEVHELFEACLNHVQQPTRAELPASLRKELSPPQPKRSLLHFVTSRNGTFTMIGLFVASILISLAVLMSTDPAGEQSMVQHGQVGKSGSDDTAEDTDPVVLGYGYTRKGNDILFDGKRIDRAGVDDLNRVARNVSREIKLASNIDTASFKVLNREYCKDKQMVYYKWTNPARFWLVELPEADPKTFEAVSGNLAKDQQHVWWYGDILQGLDPKTLEVVNPGYVWKDSESVWYQHEPIEGADPKSFRHVGQAYYRDKNRVYWSMTPLEGADPKTFRSFGNEIPYGADKKSVWHTTEILPNMDPATFGVVHQSAYKDKTGVYCDGILVPGASPETTRKLADLNESLTSLLTDGESYFVYIASWNDVYRVAPKADGLHVSREVWEGETNSLKRLGKVSARLTENGWQDLKAPASKQWGEAFYKQREAQTLSQYKDEFQTAWEIITGKKNTVGSSEELARIMNAPAAGNYAEPKEGDFVLLQEYRRALRKFNKYYRQWLALHPDIQAQVDSDTSVDVAEAFGAELFGGFDSKLPAEDLNQWRVASLNLTQKLYAIQIRGLRPPVVATPILRDELIRQAAEMLDEQEIPKGKTAEDVIDPQIDEWRVHFPNFLSLEPADEKQLQSGQPINRPEDRIKSAKAVLENAGIEISRMTKHLLKKHKQDKMTPIQKELLAQIITAESLAVKANP